MTRWTAAGRLARTAGAYLVAGARDLAGALLHPGMRPGPEPRCDPPIPYEDPWEGYLNGDDDAAPFDER